METIDDDREGGGNSVGPHHNSYVTIFNMLLFLLLIPVNYPGQDALQTSVVLCIKIKHSD